MPDLGGYAGSFPPFYLKADRSTVGGSAPSNTEEFSCDDRTHSRW